MGLLRCPSCLGESTVGPIGLSVFPFNHYEQGLAMTGTLTVKDGAAGRQGDVDLRLRQPRSLMGLARRLHVPLPPLGAVPASKT